VTETRAREGGKGESKERKGGEGADHDPGLYRWIPRREKGKGKMSGESCSVAGTAGEMAGELYVHLSSL
jgi:hypothetical protein